DGWSLKVLLLELGAHYASALEHRDSPIVPLSLQYPEWAASTQDKLQDPNLQDDIAYWRTQLAGSPAIVELPRDTVGLARSPHPGQVISRHVPEEVWRPLADLARRHRATPFMVLLAAKAAFLHRYCGQDDLVIGTPSASRLRPAVRPLIGLFINTLPLRIAASANLDFLTLLEHVRSVCLAAYRHQRVPFDRLVQALHPSRTIGANPIFSTMLTLHNEVQMPEFPGVSVTFEDLPTGFAKLPLAVAARLRPQGIRLDFEYATDLWQPATAVRAAGHFEAMMAALGRDPHAPIGQHDLMSSDDRRFLKTHLEGARRAWPGGFVLDRIAAHGRSTPDRIAVETIDARLTYAELLERVEGFAGHLHARGVRAGQHVGLCLDRTERLIIAILALWRLGAAYVPVETDHPPARIRNLLKAASARHLIVEQTTSRGDILDPSATIEWAEAPSSTAPIPAFNVDATAYVLFTSGSTGRPKGVVVPHRAVRNLMSALDEVAPIDIDDRLLSVTTVCFDISVVEFFSPLVAGATVVMAPKGTAGDPSTLVDLLERHEVTVLQATPTTLRLLAEHEAWRGRPKLRVWSGGEVLTEDLAHQLLAKTGGVWNLYGPTETTVYATGGRVTPETLHPTGAPLGAPLPNVKLAVVDRNLQPVLPGVHGELLIAGDNLADGYIGAKSLTKARFIELDGERHYRTGDIVHLDAEGRLIFHGRNDHQVKVRGFRVEPAEVEAALRATTSATDVAVIAHRAPDGDRLVAYVCGGDADPAAWRKALQNKLPEYMVPSLFVPLNAFPVGPTGKLDRSRLPAPSANASVTGGPKPKDPVDLRLARLWKELLGVDSIGLDTNFFDAGGHSLLVVKLASRIESVFGQRIPVAAFFQSQTLETQADLLRGGGAAEQWRMLYPAQPKGHRPPLFVLGAVTRARALAPLLPPDQPLYGLHLFGLESELGNRELTVPQLATRYLEEVRTLQPEGPYRLVGYCEDAKIALEMALQLRWADQPVDFLGFIDMVWLDGHRSRARHRFKRNIQRFGTPFLVHWAKRRLHGSWIEQRDRVVDPYRKTVNRLRNRDLPVELKNRRLVSAIQHALQTYAPRAYPGDLDVFLSGEYFSPRAETLLRGMAEGRLRVHEVAGLHDTLFVPPQVQDLAERIETCLHRSSPKSEMER
ncbi:MAG: amino acid adenylation domain-containing protein, partial [Myxococcota bacterium]